MKINLHFRAIHNTLHESMGSLPLVLEWPRYDSSLKNIDLVPFIIIIIIIIIKLSLLFYLLFIVF
jgi:hypothetical protein